MGKTQWVLTRGYYRYGLTHAGVRLADPAFEIIHPNVMKFMPFVHDKRYLYEYDCPPRPGQTLS